jgi:hypothetical protein
LDFNIIIVSDLNTYQHLELFILSLKIMIRVILLITRVFALVGLVLVNVSLAMNWNSTTNFSLLVFKIAMADDVGGGGGIYKKDYSECYVGGSKLLDFSSFCWMTLTCVSGNILPTYVNHP